MQATRIKTSIVPGHEQVCQCLICHGLFTIHRCTGHHIDAVNTNFTTTTTTNRNKATSAAEITNQNTHIHQEKRLTRIVDAATVPEPPIPTGNVPGRGGNGRAPTALLTEGEIAGVGAVVTGAVPTVGAWSTWPLCSTSRMYRSRSPGSYPDASYHAFQSCCQASNGSVIREEDAVAADTGGVETATA